METGEVYERQNTLGRLKIEEGWVKQTSPHSRKTKMNKGLFSTQWLESTANRLAKKLAAQFLFLALKYEMFLVYIFVI